MTKNTRADLFLGLGHPTRRKILEELAPHGALRVKHLLESTGCSQPLVSKHLGILIRAGLVTFEEYGRIRWFSLEPEALAEAKRWIVQCEEQCAPRAKEGAKKKKLRP